MNMANRPMRRCAFHPMGQRNGRDGARDFRIVVALPEDDGDVVRGPVVARNS
jgi:hypothetical protein